MKPFLIFIFLILSFTCYAQDRIRTIVDKTNNSPVSFATIKVLNTTRGAISAANGEFSVSVFRTDSVMISSVGYHTLIIKGNELGAVVQLDPKPEMLQGVVVKETVPVRKLVLGNGKDVIDELMKCRYGTKGAEDDCWPWGPSGKKEEFAEKILLPDSTKVYNVEKIYIPTRKSSAYGPLLLRVYAEDVVTGKPGEELFVRMIDVKSKEVEKAKVIVDLTGENLSIAGSRAFFVSVGWPPGITFSGDVTTIALFATNNDNTYARNLVSLVYEWYPFGMMSNAEPQKKRIGTMYAVELEERVYR